MNKRTRAETFFILVAAELFCHIHERPAQITQSEKKRNIRLCAGEMEIWRLPAYLIYLWIFFFKASHRKNTDITGCRISFSDMTLQQVNVFFYLI